MSPKLFGLKLIVGIFMLLWNGYLIPVHSENPMYPSSMASGTIPIIHITTEAERPIEDKETAIPALFYIEQKESAYEVVGSKESPISLTIKGRGNYTWEQPKKPYKLKFDSKISLFGLPKSKHYALMAHIVNSGHVWADNEAGFELARKIGMSWAPHTVPVELIINDEYMGVYFLSETVRIEENRVNIFEQEDEETDPEIIPYGWLVEIDNHWDDNQLRFYEYDDRWIVFTFHSPEVLSHIQWDYIEFEMKEINEAIHDSDDPDRWTNYIDAESLAQYFIVREILHDPDAYSGSFYMTKDKEDKAKWKVGPIWDCTSQTDMKDSYITHWKYSEGDQNLSWMPTLMRSPAFEKAVKEVWRNFYSEENINAVIAHVRQYAEDLDEAFAANNERWKELHPNQHYQRKEQLGYIERALKNNAQWIDSHLNINEICENFNTAVEEITLPENPEKTYFTIEGIRLKGEPNSPGLYILRMGNKSRVVLK